jgi:hypothetical protein
MTYKLLFTPIRQTSKFVTNLTSASTLKLKLGIAVMPNILLEKNLTSASTLKLKLGIAVMPNILLEKKKLPHSCDYFKTCLFQLWSVTTSLSHV